MVLRNDRHCSTWPTWPGGIDELKRYASRRGGSKPSFFRRSCWWVQPWVAIGERTGPVARIGAPKLHLCPVKISNTKLSSLESIITRPFVPGPSGPPVDLKANQGSRLPFSYSQTWFNRTDKSLIRNRGFVYCVWSGKEPYAYQTASHDSCASLIMAPLVLMVNAPTTQF